MTYKSHVPCVPTKINSYLNASNQDEGFNRESKGRPLKVWHTPESVGIWEIHGSHYTLYNPYLSNLLELTTPWVSVNTWFRNVMESFQFLFIIVQRFVSPEQDLPIFRNCPEVFSTLVKLSFHIYNSFHPKILIQRCLLMIVDLVKEAKRYVWSPWKWVVWSREGSKS